MKLAVAALVLSSALMADPVVAALPSGFVQQCCTYDDTFAGTKAQWEGWVEDGIAGQSAKECQDDYVVPEGVSCVSWEELCTVTNPAFGFGTPNNYVCGSDALNCCTGNGVGRASQVQTCGVVIGATGQDRGKLVTDGGYMCGKTWQFVRPSTENATNSSSFSSTLQSSDVLIIGAGAAGLTAAYDLLRKTDYSVKILEASSVVGGRLRKNESFTDFPIDVGGEWIHKPPSVLDKIYGDPSVNVTDSIQTMEYLTTYEEWDDGAWTEYQFANQDYKFINYTWFDYFNDWIVPEVGVDSTIEFDCQVQQINYTTTPVMVTCKDGRMWAAQHVLVTVSMKILQDQDIDFVPALPKRLGNVIDQYIFMPGMKVFLKFRRQFYKQAFEFGSDYAGVEYGARYFYDATYGQNSSDNVLGNLAVGEAALNYTDLTDQEIIDAILQQLDEVYNNRATRFFIEGFVQDWTDEVFVRGAYTHLLEDDDMVLDSLIGELKEPLDNRVFFAGEAIPVDDEFSYGFAHGAAFSGRAAAKKIQALLDGLDSEVTRKGDLSEEDAASTKESNPQVDDTLSSLPDSLPDENPLLRTSGASPLRSLASAATAFLLYLLTAMLQ